MIPTDFDVHTNDQSIGKETQHITYANDLAVMAKSDSFEMVENKLETMSETLGQLYPRNHLKPIPSKTQVGTLNLHNNQANRKIKIK